LGIDLTVFEAHPSLVGGLSRTERYKGYRFDIGGHRFFTKSDEIRELWHRFLPDEDFLMRQRMSRIYYRGGFFRYPLDAKDALRKLGLIEATRCGFSYLASAVRPKKPAVSFEDWVVAHFGRRLFEIFFKTYTEKVWGIPCSEISADWAAQRIKGLSLFRAVTQALVGQRGEIVKTLIEQFEYPRLGPGMMWERVAEDLSGRGVAIELGAKVIEIHHEGGRIGSLVVESESGSREVGVDAMVSSMPIRALVTGLRPLPPSSVLDAARALRYRDFLTVVLVLDDPDVFPDNWIYIHDPSVRLGRVQNFKNWSPEMVPDPRHTALGLEYFCNEGDDLWASTDQELLERGRRDLATIGLIDADKVIDGTVIRVHKAYPVYDEDYAANVAVIREYLEGEFDNLQLCGRNGMHKYNNQDHAMMTGLMAARNLAGQHWDQWRVNQDAEYLEEISADDAGGRMVPRKVTVRDE
jgi:protoporphyrinogen oxidase